jgi:hypothetical protein
MATKALEYLPRPVRKFLRRNERSAWKGLLAGAAGGLAGTIVMTQFQNAWQKAAEKKRSGDMRGGESRTRARSSEEKEDATMKAASKLARAAGRELTPEQKKQASPWVHYGFGTAMGRALGYGHGNIAARRASATRSFLWQPVWLGAFSGSR